MLMSSANCWSGREDGPRLHQIVRCVSLEDGSLDDILPGAIGVVGFACDEGIRRNHGRVGAALGPDALRKAASNMPMHGNAPAAIYDFGNITCDDGDLERAQNELGDVTASLLARGLRPIVFGGGHEMAYGHYLGIRQAHPFARLGVINFDAHFDMRPLAEDGKGTSGTPFLQMAEHEQSVGHQFSYYCVGIQEHANTAGLFDTARQWKVKFDARPDLGTIQNYIDSHEFLYVSLCMDVFAEAFAPGVSAPQALGLLPMEAIPCLELLASSKKVVSFDIAELSPPYDKSGTTGRLASAMLFTLLNASIG